jgi:DNA polymerase III subunit gamma/tau
LLYGKWRPQGFDEVVGQDHIVTTLRNALITSDAARKAGKPDPLAHAYLFSGPRGTGKTTTARILARAVNCTNLGGGDPCNTCEACLAIIRGNALDLIEMDAASNRGIEDIRELREKIGFAPSDLTRKVYLLDEVHMLTEGAFNALLKTLEEPPPHAIFILATTELHKMPATIISRCQRHDFHRVQNEAIIHRLQIISAGEGYSLPREGLLSIAVQSRGGVRDAVTMLEQAVARYGPTPTADDVNAALGLVHDPRSALLVRALIEEDLGEALRIAREVADDGIDISRFTRAAVDLLREIVPATLASGRHQVEPGAAADAGLVSLAIERGTPVRTLVAAIQQLAEADFRLDPASPIPLEVACASAILQPSIAARASVTATVAAGTPTVAAAGGAAGIRPRRPAAGDSDGALLSREQAFLKELYENCRMVNARMGAWLNDSCEVRSLDGDEIELGFFFPMHMQKVDTDCRSLVEQQAEIILGRPVRLKVTLVERTPQAKPASKRGHLAEAARAIGATPVGKE